MFDARFALPLIAALGLASPALAQSPGASLDDLDANRINPTQIMISFDYQGSACQQVGAAEIGEVTNGTHALVFPTTSTAEVCTMQVTEVDVDQAIYADTTVTRVDVTLTDPDDQVIGTGSANVEND